VLFFWVYRVSAIFDDPRGRHSARGYACIAVGPISVYQQQTDNSCQCGSSVCRRLAVLFFLFFSRTWHTHGSDIVVVIVGASRFLAEQSNTCSPERLDQVSKGTQKRRSFCRGRCLDAKLCYAKGPDMRKWPDGRHRWEWSTAERNVVALQNTYQHTLVRLEKRNHVTQ
jgi:hypothetical protein